FLSQETIDTKGAELTCNLKGRHDPCIAVRGSVVAESMAALVIADLLLLNLGASMEHLKQIYM
nr:chorismate synthase [Sulfurospirillum sp.]